MEVSNNSGSVASGAEEHQSVKRVFAQCSVFQRTPENFYNGIAWIVDLSMIDSSDAAMILDLAHQQAIVWPQLNCQILSKIRWFWHGWKVMPKELILQLSFLHEISQTRACNQFPAILQQ